MTATVVVVGGGYGGITAARALDDVADVVLIEPRDRFVHNIAALRALVAPEWVDRMFYPYHRLLDRGRVLHSRAVRVDATAVTVSSGERIVADYIILATGSAYPFPAKVDVDDSAAAKAKIGATHEALAQAESVLLLGAGPVGLELAGEIKAAWPAKTVTILDPVDDILAGRFTQDFRAELRHQLDALGIDLILGTSLRDQPPSDVGEAKTFTATTHSGRALSVDIWFRCFGVAPATNYLAGELSAARQATGHVDVTPELRLPGQGHVFAIGDITAIPEAKMAAAAGDHAGVVTANIRTLIEGGEELIRYEPGPPGIALPLGPEWGASYAPSYTSDPSGILDAETTSQIKGADLMIDDMAEALGLAR